MKKPEFERIDFYPHIKDVGDRIQLVEIANAKLAEWEREGWQLVNVKDAKVVYRTAYRCAWVEIEDTEWDTHRALLINIEELPKAECEHEPDLDFICRHCGVKLKARWEAE